MRNRAWTDADLCRLRSLWGSLSLADLARRLERTRPAVIQKARALGLPPAPRRGTLVRPLVLGLLAEGLTGREAALAAGLDRGTVRRLRLAAGLSVNAAAVADRKRQAGRDACARSNPGRKRSLAYARLAAARGWPPLPLRAVEALESLCDAGPATRRQLAVRLGLPEAYSWQSNRAGAAGGVFATLARLGMVHAVWRGGRDRDGRRRHLYLPTAEALATRAEHRKGVAS